MKRIVFRVTLLTVVLLTSGTVQAQWELMYGPNGGRVEALLVDGTDLYAGMYYNFAFRSTDNGLQWTNVNDDEGAKEVRAFLLCEGNIYAGTRRGVYRSSDKGATWDLMDNGYIPRDVTCFAAIGSNVFAGTDNGIYESTDEGENWTRLETGPNNKYIAALLCVDGIFYAATETGGLLRSSDEGASWKSDTSSLGTRLVLACASIRGTLYASTWEKGMYRSTDKGLTWQALGALQYFRVDAIVGDSTTIFAGGWEGVFRSTDQGTTWSNVSDLVTNDIITSLAMRGADVFAGTTSLGVIHSSDNGEHWAVASGGLDDVDVSSLKSFNGALFVGSSTGVWRTADYGVTWQTTNRGTSAPYSAKLYGTDTILFAGTQDQANSKTDVYRSSDSGKTWTPTLTGNQCSGITCFASLGSHVFAAGDDCAQTSTDGGATWGMVVNGLDAISGQWPIVALTSIGTNLFAGTKGGGMYLSTNNGQHWTQINEGLSERYVDCLASLGTTVFMGAYRGVFRTTNNGATWSTAGLSGTNVVSLATWGNKLIAAADDEGLFLSTDHGSSWSPISIGLEGFRIQHAQAHGSYLFVGTLSNGVWRRPLSEIVTSVGEEITVGDVGITLSCNPNPVDLNVTLAFTLIRSGFVTLNIFSTHGEKVTTLISANLEAGPHTFGWNSQGSAGGLYFVQLQSVNTTITSPVLILR